MNRKKNGGLHRDRIGTKAPGEADASPEITFEQTFLIPVSGRNGRGRISNLLNLGLRRERNGHTISRSRLHRRPLMVMDLPRIAKKFHAHGTLEYVLFRALYRDAPVRVPERRRHRSEWKIKKPQILIE